MRRSRSEETNNNDENCYDVYNFDLFIPSSQSHFIACFFSGEY